MPLSESDVFDGESSSSTHEAPRKPDLEVVYRAIHRSERFGVNGSYFGGACGIISAFYHWNACRNLYSYVDDSGSVRTLPSGVANGMKWLRGFRLYFTMAGHVSFGILAGVWFFSSLAGMINAASIRKDKENFRALQKHFIDSAGPSSSIDTSQPLEKHEMQHVGIVSRMLRLQRHRNQVNEEEMYFRALGVMSRRKNAPRSSHE